MYKRQLENGKNFFIKLGTKMIPGLVTKIVSLIDVNTGEKKEVSSLHKNEIAVCEIAFADRIVADTFAAHKTLGELILIDRVTNMTSACGVVTELHADEDGLEEKKVNKKLRSALNGQSAVTVEFPVGQHGITPVSYTHLDVYKRQVPKLSKKEKKDFVRIFQNFDSLFAQLKSFTPVSYTHLDTAPYEVLYTKWISYADVLTLKAVEEMVELYYNSRQYVQSPVSYTHLDVYKRQAYTAFNAQRRKD